MMINMKYCEKCKVSVPNPKQRCPLCQGMLTGGDGTETETFPNIPTIYRQYSLYFRLMILGSVAAGVISVMINMLLPDSGWWSLDSAVDRCPQTEQHLQKHPVSGCGAFFAAVRLGWVYRLASVVS